MATEISHNPCLSVNTDSRMAEALEAAQRHIAANYPEMLQRTAVDYCRKYAVMVFRPGNQSERRPDEIYWADSETDVEVYADIQQRAGKATITMYAKVQ